MLSTTAFAKHPPLDERIVEQFEKTFPAASNVKWSEYETFYEVVFYNNQIMCRARYDRKGTILSVLRYYYEKDLPHFISAKVKERYPGKKIFGVTEVNSEVGLDYRIVLEDEKRWYHVNSDESGNLHLFKKYKKA